MLAMRQWASSTQQEQTMSEEPTKAVPRCMIDDMRMRKLSDKTQIATLTVGRGMGPTSCVTSRKSRPLVAQQSD